MNPPYAPVFVGGINGQVGGIGVAPGVPNSAVDATVQANQSFQSTFRANGNPCAGVAPDAPTCPLAVNLNTFPSGTLKTPYFLEWSLGIERELGSHGSLRVDYVGTRAVHEPYQVQLNGYQNVCDGCFAPFAYNKPLDPRFGNVNEFRTDAAATTPDFRPASRNSLPRSRCTAITPIAIVSMRSRTAACSLSQVSASSLRCRAIFVASTATATTTFDTTSPHLGSMRFRFTPPTQY